MDGPRLNWGLLATFEPGRGGRLPLDLGRAWQLAGESLNLMARPVERFELADTLNGDPGHVRSDQAKANFPAIFALAVAAAPATGPLRSHSRATVITALRAWAQVYRPDGNPIDEWFFVPLLQAVDLVADEDLRAWAREFAVSGDRFYAGRAERNPGRTVDFVLRDALHYHVAAVQPLVEVRQHIEFARTGNAFDRERRDDGNPVFQHAPWDPARGRVLLRLARAAFPEIRGWTEQIVDHRYDPRTKLLAAIYGEPQRAAEWQ